MQRQQATQSDWHSEGFQANEYLRREEGCSAHWNVRASKLTSVLVKEPSGWGVAESAPVPETEAPTQLKFDFSLESLFRFLADQWRNATEHMSNINKIIAHPAYQQIIGMGKAAPDQIVPLLFRELEQRPDHWFLALKEITKQDPAQAEDTFNGALEAWLKWGRQQGHLI